MSSWNSFKYRAFHGETLNMAAGDSVEITVQVEWGSDDLVPHDFSVVAWSTAEPVTLTVGENHSSQSFPNYKLESDVTLHGLFGGVVQCSDCDGSSAD